MDAEQRLPLPLPLTPDPKLVAELALCRRRWLGLPIADRRRHWETAANQLGELSGIAGWVEMRAWELAGIHRWQARLLAANPFTASEIAERLRPLLSLDPLGQASQESARERLVATDDRFDAHEAGAA